MAATINLVLAIAWLVVGVILLVVPQVLEGHAWADDIRPNRQLLGGIALVLAVYNLVRMQSIRAFRRDQDAIHGATATRQRLDDEHEREVPEPPNAAFNFEDPGAPPRGPVDRPPSAN